METWSGGRSLQREVKIYSALQHASDSASALRKLSWWRSFCHTKRGARETEITGTGAEGRSVPYTVTTERKLCVIHRIEGLFQAGVVQLV